MSTTYLFTSQRLGFRTWQQTDIAAMAEINADPAVMEFFPGIKTYGETADFIDRMQQQMAAKGYCYFAVDKLEDNTFIGFIGLSEQTFESAFTPCIDIGWRLKRSEWGSGFATEGAKKCLDYVLNILLIEVIVAIAPKANAGSLRVMEKIGMREVAVFIHPLLIGNGRLQECVVYKITGKQFNLLY